MAKTSNAVKDRWNAKAYDDLRIRIPKGRKADIMKYAEAHEESINGLVNSCLCSMLGMTEDEWKKTLNESE